jgi:bacterioferritin-associated ferredoxin
MYVCVCNQVTDSDILEALSRQLKAATCCERCAECAHELLQSHANPNALQAA